MEDLLSNKIYDFSNYIESICDNEEKKKDIKKALTDLPLYKIMLFINFLDKKQIDNQIDDFVKLFSLQNNQDNRNKIKEYIDYFIEVKDILNK